MRPNLPVIRGVYISVSVQKKQGFYHIGSPAKLSPLTITKSIFKNDPLAQSIQGKKKGTRVTGMLYII